METRNKGINLLVEELCAIPGGEQILRCIQCGTCSASCPNANRMEYTPRKLIAMVRAGRHDEVLSSNTMWYCASCYLCTVRCPRDIKPTHLMHALESLAIRHGLATQRTDTPIMYRTFVDSMRSSGRIHELSFTLRFYRREFIYRLKTNPISALKLLSLIRMLPLAIGLFLHGRMGLTASKTKGREQLNAILKRAEELGGGF